MLFTQLLLEDYLKWRPALFRAFCVTADAEPLVAAAARNCFHSLLMPRSPRLAFDGFVPLLFILNGCVDHPTQKATLDGPSATRLRWRGAPTEHRLTILRGLLSKMSDEQRLQCTSKLCQEVLAAVPDGTLALDPPRGSSPSSPTRSPSSPRARSRSPPAPTRTATTTTTPPAAAASAAANAARGKLLTQVARKATVESIVPIVIELKRHLEGEHSPLLKDVFMFLRELLRDHKQRMQDILSPTASSASRSSSRCARCRISRSRCPSASRSRRRPPLARLNGTPGGSRTPGRRVPGSESKAPAPSPTVSTASRCRNCSAASRRRCIGVKLAAVAGNGVDARRRPPPPQGAMRAPTPPPR